MTTLAACGSDSDSGAAAGGQKQAKLAVFVLATANGYSQANLAGVQEAAKEAGNVDVRVFDGGFDASQQLNQVRDATASGQYDGFIIAANDGSVVAPSLEEAVAQGIHVGAVHTPPGGKPDGCDDVIKGMVAFACEDFYVAGEDYADKAAEACEGVDRCKVASIMGDFSLPFDAARQAGIEAAIKKHPNLDLVAKGEAQYTRDAGLSTAQDILQSNPDVDVWLTSGDQMSLGIEQALDDAGAKLGPPSEGGVAILGNAASFEGVKKVREGRWYASYVMLPKSEGYEIGKRVIAAVRGKQAPYERLLTNVDLPVAKDIGSKWIDQSYKGDFKGEWDG